MKDYKYRGGYGTHTIQIEFQSGKYKGSVSYFNGGNCNGLSLLEGVDDSLKWIRKFLENTCKFKSFDDGWFNMVLVDEDGNELIIEEEHNNLGSYIVGVNIIDYEREDTK